MSCMMESESMARLCDLLETGGSQLALQSIAHGEVRAIGLKRHVGGRTELRLLAGGRAHVFTCNRESLDQLLALLVSKKS